MSTSLPHFYVAIPARYASTRFPGKPLCLIRGKTMIRCVLENAVQSGAAQTVVATDDQRIVDEVAQHGGQAMMTAPTHRSGTDRAAEVAQAHAWNEDAIVVNVQGDEPGVTPALIQLVARALNENQDAAVATLACPIAEASDLFNPNVVKVVCADDGRALYFSRAPIPWVRDLFAACGHGHDPAALPALPADVPFLRHIGLYAYRVRALRQIVDAPPAACEVAESLEQLRAMALGLSIHVTVVPEAPQHGVDTEADWQRLNA